jgi:hypothetical protein
MSSDRMTRVLRSNYIERAKDWRERLLVQRTLARLAR